MEVSRPSYYQLQVILLGLIVSLSLLAQAGNSLEPDHGFAEFLAKAPVNKISLVFASESAMHPGTVMGHVLLKIEGRDFQGQQKDHAISFFTRFDDVSFPELVLKSFITGKQGHYSLSPYHETVQHYLFKEGRNLWEYELDLTPEQIQRLHRHLYELKNVEFTYFFHKFNCATLFRNILAKEIPDLSRAGHLWVTPLDLVRSLAQTGKIKSRKFLHTNKWLIKAFHKGQTLAEKNLTPAHLSQLNYRLEKAKSGFSLEEQKISQATWSEMENGLKEKYQIDDSQGELDFSNFSKPEETGPDSQVSAGFYQSPGLQGFKVGVLPLSHFFIDDQTGYFTESEIKLGHLSLIQNQDRSVEIFDFDLFSVSSYPLHDSFTGGYSGKFNLGFNRLNVLDLGARARSNVGVALGKTWFVSRDLDLFLLVGSALWETPSSRLWGKLEMGLSFRQIFKMKSQLKWTRSTQFLSKTYDELSFEHSIPWRNWSLVAKASRHSSQNLHFDSSELQLKHHF